MYALTVSIDVLRLIEKTRIIALWHDVPSRKLETLNNEN